MYLTCNSILPTGTFFKIDNTELTPGEDYTLNEGTTEWGYVPTTIGEQTIKVIGKNIDGNIIEREIVINVRNINWLWDVTSTATSVNVNEELPLTVELETLDSNVSPTYEYFYEILDSTSAFN